MISTLALGLLHLSQPTLAVHIGASRSCHKRPLSRCSNNPYAEARLTQSPRRQERAASVATSSPSVFAVLRLIMNSNLVGCSAQRAVRAIRNSKSLSGQGPQLLGSKPPVLLVKTPTCKNHLLKRVWESVRRAGVGKGRQATVYVQEIPALGRRALAIRELPMRCAARLPWCSHALP
jgi:hypothetical protein